MYNLQLLERRKYNQASKQSGRRPNCLEVGAGADVFFVMFLVAPSDMAPLSYLRGGFLHRPRDLLVFSMSLKECALGRWRFLNLMSASLGADARASYGLRNSRPPLLACGRLTVTRAHSC